MTSEQLLAGDIGSTNCRLAIVELPSLKVIRKREWPTQELEAFLPVVKEFLGKEQVAAISIGAAGPVTGKEGRRIVKLSNAPLVIREAELRKVAKHTLLVNDFLLLGHALTGKMQMKRVRTGKASPGEPRLLIGPGTGLGSCLILADGSLLPGESCRADLVIRTPEEYAIASFIRAELGLMEDDPVWWDELLSGRGLVRLHRYLRAARHPEAAPCAEAQEVAAGKDEACAAARALFTRFLARAARDVALITLARGGVVIAGGIVQRNPSLLSKEFFAEFDRHPEQGYRELLSQIPVSILTDEEAALKGAAIAVKG